MCLHWGDETELQPNRRRMQVSRKVPELHLPVNESMMLSGKEIEEEATTEERICC